MPNVLSPQCPLLHRLVPPYCIMQRPPSAASQRTRQMHKEVCLCHIIIFCVCVISIIMIACAQCPLTSMPPPVQAIPTLSHHAAATFGSITARQANAQGGEVCCRCRLISF